MAYRCKHCGAVLNVADRAVNVTCEYCNTTFSVQSLCEISSANESVNLSIEKMLVRAEILLEDGDFSKAEELYDKILTLEPTCAPAYVGQVQAFYQIRLVKDIFKRVDDILQTAEFRRAIQFATPEYYAQLQEYQLLAAYEMGAELEDNATTPEEYQVAYDYFSLIENYKDAPQRAAACLEKAQALREKAQALAQQEQALQEQEKIETAKVIKKCSMIVLVVCVLFSVAFLTYHLFLRLPLTKMDMDALLDQGNYQQALQIAQDINNPAELAPQIERALEAKFAKAREFEEKGFYTRAWLMYTELEDHGDARMRADRIRPLVKPVTRTSTRITALKGDGTLEIKCDLDDWNKSFEKKELESWSDIAYFTTAGNRTIAIQSDGTILQYGNSSNKNTTSALNQNMGNDLIAIEEYSSGYVGLKRDGTLAFSEETIIPSLCTAWSNIAMIGSDGYEIFAFTHDGRKLSTAKK